jgi:hypothetical protein
MGGVNNYAKRKIIADYLDLALTRIFKGKKKALDFTLRL